MAATMTRGSVLCLPRFATPRNPDRLTLGPQVAEMASRLGTPLMPFQQLVVDVAFELEADGSFAYDEVDLLVPRQSGKTTLVKAKTTHRLTAMARTHGPQRSMYTAQTRLAARKKLEQDFAESLRHSRSFPEVAHSRQRPSRPTQWRLSLNNGLEHIQFGTGSYWQIDAPSRTGGHGDTLDDGTIDEAFAHEDDEVEGAIRPAQATRADAQLWVLSTAGDGKSKYLWRKVLAGRAAAESGSHGRVAYFEWSAPDDADPSDPDVWRGCSPALERTISLRFLEGEWERACRKGQEGINTFRRAYLNQWPEIPILEDEDRQRVIQAADWEACKHPDSHPLEPLSFAVDVSPERTYSSIGVAGLRHDGRVHLEVVENRPGVAWVVDRLAAVLRKAGVDQVTLCPGAAAGSLTNDLGLAGIKVNDCSAQQSTQACGSFFDGIMDRRYLHIGQPPLTVAVDGAEKRKSGDAWVWDRRNSTVDITPLVAVTLAAWALHTYAPPIESGLIDPNSYEDEDW